MGVRKWIFDAAAVDLTTEFAKKKEKVVRLPLISVVVPVMNTYKYPGFWCFFRCMYRPTFDTFNHGRSRRKIRRVSDYAWKRIYLYYGVSN